MKSCKYWFRYLTAPDEVAETARNLKVDAGLSPRVNSLGETIVSEMFMMHCKAATVCKMCSSGMKSVYG